MTNVEKALRAGMRNGFERGLLEGSQVWTIVGTLAVLGYLAGRALRRDPQVIFSELLTVGESIGVTLEAPS